jgi:hypothetical protein
MNEKKFKPIKLELVLETAKEAALFYCIFNYAPVCDAVGKHLNPNAIRQALDLAGLQGSEFKYTGSFDAFSKSIEVHPALKE